MCVFFPSMQSCYGVECLEDLRAASRPILDRWKKAEVRKQPSATFTTSAQILVFSCVLGPADMWQRPSRWNRIVCSHHSLGLMYEAAEVEPIGACSERATLAGAQGQFREGKNSGGLHFRRRHEATRLGGGGNSSFRPHQLVGEEPNRATKKGGQHEGSVSNTVYSRGLDTTTNVLIPYDRVACSDALQIRRDVEISSRCMRLPTWTRIYVLVLLC